ncbi:PREDICTED: signal transducer and transcription activator-like isoform X2 [Rhagoletis zephyria]|uniref:signal transducer and transcription activator-like isoform X2 n=1 Tax=Rhagoletis zephyria TaxID=28612 RepID=UPI0008114AD5|nr:PREDICTED: signal transducer and transcription activator-like isoform X2 [Rhagoletis zephyria]
MSLWKRIACFPELEKRMTQYYDGKGLAEIRVQFAAWIEDTLMSQQQPPASDKIFEQLVNSFYEGLKQKLITLDGDNLFKFKIREICTHLGQTTPIELYTYVRNGLLREIQALKEMPQNPYMYNPAVVGCNGMGMNTGNPYMGSVGAHLADVRMTEDTYALPARIQKLAVDVDNMRLAIQGLQGEQEAVVKYFNQTRAMVTPQELEELDNQYKQQYLILCNRKNGVVDDLRRVISEYDTIQDQVIMALKMWQRNQALAGNGAPFHDNLDDIQRCVEMLVDMVSKIHAFVNNLILMSMGETEDPILAEMLNHVRSVQRLLVLSAFIVERQPPQVMKTQTRFAAAVRWLIGPQLGVYTNTPVIECVILSEAQAQRHAANNSNSDMQPGSPPQSSGEIINNISTMEYQQATRVFSASFRNMQLKKIKRAEKKGTESVMDEKFSLLFYTTVVFNEFKISCWTLSLPVVVIVHGNQEPQSWATITWDNAFSDITREPFQVPEKVRWAQLSAALNTKFGSATGRNLTEDNLNFLYEKLFRNEAGEHTEFITWAQFCKEPLPDRSFTFWDWFFAIMKLTKDHLLNLWKEGLIVGFINKRKTLEEILPMQQYGTFLLRFSDSELGGITVAFVDDQGNKLMLAPWTSRDLNIRCLADRIHDLNVLRIVYPKNLPRDEAFGSFYSHHVDEQKTTRDGYVASDIRVNVPAIEGGSVVGTPQHQPQDIPMPNDNFISEFDSILY